MSSGTQIDLDWTGVEPPSPKGGYGGQDPLSTNGGQGGQASSPASTPDGSGAAPGAYLTDEEILGITPVGKMSPSHRDVILNEVKNPSSIDESSSARKQRDSSGKNGPQNDGEDLRTAGQASAAAQTTPAPMPAWMQALAGDPQHGAEAQQFWQEHQAFRAAFSSPEEARTIKELFPGGAQEAAGLRQAAQSVDRIDAAIFSGDARAQSEVVAELAQANPAAFRSLVAEAEKVLAGMGQTPPVNPNAPTLRKSGEGWGTQQASATRLGGIPNEVRNLSSIAPENGQRDSSVGPAAQALPRNDRREVAAGQSGTFDPVAYSNFERSTNDAVARDVRSTISDTLTRVLPEGLAEGAARRIGDDIFNEVHRALAADRTLSEQVGAALRAPVASGQGWQFGTAEQQRVAAILAGRAKQLVPSVARRVIGEWTSSVLGSARTKAARQATAASRVDIAAAGGSLDSMPLRAMSPREVNYASMSDDEILGM